MAKEKPFLTALRMEIAAFDRECRKRGRKLDADIAGAGEALWRLRDIAKAQLEKAAKGDTHAAIFVVERLDGKVPQAVVGDDEHSPVRFEVTTDEQRVQAITTLLQRVNGHDKADA